MDGSVKVAVLLDLQGGQASIGRPAMNGFVLALQEVSPARAPKPFAALVDTKTDKAVTLAAAKKLAPAVSIGAGFTDNDSVLVAGPVFQQAGTPFLSIGATDPSLPSVIGDKIFLTPFGDNAQAAAAAEFAKKEFGGSAAILWDDTSAYTIALPRYFRARFEELGGSVPLDASYHGGCDISALGGRVAALSPRPAFVYLAGLPDCIGEVAASLRSAGVSQPIIGGDGLDTPNVLNSPAGPVDGVWFTTHAWLSEATGSPQARRFIQAYKEAYGNAPNDAFAALGYDAGKLVLDVLRRADDLTPQSIAKALEETSGFQGVTGTIAFSPESHAPKKTVWIIKVEQGKEVLAQGLIPDKVPPPMVPKK